MMVDAVCAHSAPPPRWHATPFEGAARPRVPELHGGGDVVLSVYFSVVIGLLPLSVAQSPTDFNGLVSRTPVVAVGRITEVGEPPGGWSTGGLHFAQKVKYKIVSALKGEGLADEVTVHFV